MVWRKGSGLGDQLGRVRDNCTRIQLSRHGTRSTSRLLVGHARFVDLCMRRHCPKKRPDHGYQTYSPPRVQIKSNRDSPVV